MCTCSSGFVGLAGGLCGHTAHCHCFPLSIYSVLSIAFFFMCTGFIHIPYLLCLPFITLAYQLFICDHTLFAQSQTRRNASCPTFWLSLVMTGTDGPYRESGEREQVSGTFQVVPCDLTTLICWHTHIHIHTATLRTAVSGLLFLQNVELKWDRVGQMRGERGWRNGCSMLMAVVYIMRGEILWGLLGEFSHSLMQYWNSLGFLCAFMITGTCLSVCV